MRLADENENISEVQKKDSVIRTTKTEVITDTINGITTTITTKTEKRVKTTNIETNSENPEEKSTVTQDGAAYSFIFTWNKRNLSPHWSGFSMGFLNYDASAIPNGDAMFSKSLYYSLNLFEYHLPIARTNLMLVSGIGMDWHRYRYDDTNVAITKNTNGIAEFQKAPDGITYTKSMLNINYFTLPLLLEYQFPIRNTEIYLSAGVVGYLKYTTNSKVEYKIDGDKQKRNLGKDLNIRPFDLKYRVQFGIENISVVSTYSPFSLFGDGKGPALHSYTIGLQLGF